MCAQNLTIDPEFRDKVPPMTEAEFKHLEENIERTARRQISKRDREICNEKQSCSRRND